MSESGSVSVFSFDGRISRGSFWAVIGVMILAVMVVGILAAVVIPQMVKGAEPSASMPTWMVICLVVLYGAALWLSFANYAKRLHDMDHSGWLALAVLIPLVNLIMLIYCGAKEGTAGPNKYGAGPAKVTL